MKKWIYRKSRFHTIAVSQWIAALANESIMGDRQIEVIPNAVDTQFFRPTDKAAAKRTLGLSGDSRTIMFALSANTMDRRKGLDTILKALPLLKTKRVVMMPTAIGELGQAFNEIWLEHNCLDPRHLSSDEELRAYYTAADIIWHPSLADNCPLVCLEAMSCGTPVIASGVGGVPEIIKDDHNGMLISQIDGAALAAETDRFFAMADSSREVLSQNCRLWIEKHHNLDLFTKRHLSLYRSICNGTLL